MSSGARAALRGSKGGSFFSNLIFGSILIVLGLFQQVERYRALSIVTGVVIILIPIGNILFGPSGRRKFESVEERITDELEKERKHRRRKKLARKLTLLSFPGMIISLQINSSVFNQSMNVELVTGIVFLIMMLTFVLGLTFWYVENSRWKEVAGEAYKQEMRQLSSDERELRHRKVKRKMFIFLGLWLGMWALNWTVFFTNPFYTLIGGVIFVISLSGFIFMYFAINYMSEEGRVATAIANV